MKRGDIVQWTSQSSGFVRTKRGHIVEVVPKGERPLRRSKNWGLNRDHESYVVRAHVINGSDRQRRHFRNYWPLVSQLSLVEEHSV